MARDLLLEIWLTWSMLLARSGIKNVKIDPAATRAAWIDYFWFKTKNGSLFSCQIVKLHLSWFWYQPRKATSFGGTSVISSTCMDLEFKKKQQCPSFNYAHDRHFCFFWMQLPVFICKSATQTYISYCFGILEQNENNVKPSSDNYQKD